MKMNFLKIGFFAVVFAMTLFATSCAEHNPDHDGDGHEQHDSDADEKTGKEYTSAFVCPMHCEGSGSDTEGKCPTCKMDYVANKNHVEDNHEH